ncbi:MAG: zinc ribbon domain-containing protein [Planctomycetota bacterium]
MGSLLAALLELQSVESQLRQVRDRRRRRTRAAKVQQRRIDELRQREQQVQETLSRQRRHADSASVDVKAAEEKISRLRSGLNSAKTNKEYASILTQLNTVKADNAKREEEALQLMQSVDETSSELADVRKEIENEQKRLEQIEADTAEEVGKLDAMIEDLQARRDAAAAEVPDAERAVFERIADNYDGEAMAVVEQHGKKPPHQFVCGGCFMSINAEHVNALRVRDEVRRCDSCGRILYLESQAQNATTNP